jgi:hypothetical protein
VVSERTLHYQPGFPTWFQNTHHICDNALPGSLDLSKRSFAFSPAHYQHGSQGL